VATGGTFRHTGEVIVIALATSEDELLTGFAGSIVEVSLEGSSAHARCQRL